MVDIIKADNKAVANVVEFDVAKFNSITTEKAMLAKAEELGGTLTDKALWNDMAILAIHHGELDKANKVNVPRSFRPVLDKFAAKYDTVPGRVPYKASSLDTLTIAMNHYVTAGFAGRVDMARFAVEHFKGSIAQKGAKLGKMLEHFKASVTVPTSAEMTTWFDGTKAKERGLEAAVKALHAAMVKLNKEHGATLKEQPANREKFILAFLNITSLKETAIDKSPDGSGELLPEDELAQIRAARGVANGATA